jgi:hypothetical protein
MLEEPKTEMPRRGRKASLLGPQQLLDEDEEEEDEDQEMQSADDESDSEKEDS